MKKTRAAALLLALALFLPLLPVQAAGVPRLPIYTGDLLTDYMAQELLQEIPTAGLGPMETIGAVYDWIIANCARSGWDGTTYVDLAQAAQASKGLFSQETNQKLQQGTILLRQNLRAKSRLPLSAYDYIDFDSNHFVAQYAQEMMVKRTGSCAHFASLFAVLLGQLGFDCRVFHGQFHNMDGSTVEHTWNYVLLDGTYYWADIRIDHALGGGRQYFMKADTETWALEHTWDPAYSDYLAQEAPALSEELEQAALAAAAPWQHCSPWAKEAMTQAAQLGLLPPALYGSDLTVSISRQEFSAVAVALYEALRHSVPAYTGPSPFTDTEDPDVLRAYSLGIVNGMGDGTFAPLATLTREQAVTMLGRVYELALTNTISGGAGLPVSSQHFSDHRAISPYASHYVYFFVGRSIVAGMGDGSFAPQALMTREQALKIAAVTAQTFWTP